MRGEESRWQDLVVTWNTCVRTVSGCKVEGHPGLNGREGL